MKIIFMGTPDFAAGALKAIAEAGHQVTAVVTQPDRQKGRGKEIAYPPVKEYALAQGIPVLQPVRIKAPEAVEELKKYDTKDVYIIGGESVYRLLLPYCDTAHITKIDHAYEADAHIPNLDGLPEWRITADSDEQVYFDITYRFLKYERS